MVARKHARDVALLSTSRLEVCKFNGVGFATTGTEAGFAFHNILNMVVMALGCLAMLGEQFVLLFAEVMLSGTSMRGPIAIDEIFRL